MKCDVCGKNNATIHVTEIINGEVKELHICDACAQNKGMIKNHKNFGLADFLAGLTDFGISAEDRKALEDFDLRCPKCGLSFEDFKKIGRLGCSNCYEAFKDGLMPLLRKIHGSNSHSRNGLHKIGPDSSQQKFDLTDLKAKLKQAIKKEEFEEAARLRDLIRGLNKKKKKNDEIK
jgi:protein arginine kinase activator